MRRPGIVAPPGQASDVNLMLSWRPGAISCYYDYLRNNQIFQYKAQNPGANIIVRFQHPQNWFKNREQSAVQYAQQIAGKWNELRPLNPYVIFANELNMYFENGDTDPANQPLYETEQFYEQAGWWITRVAQIIKSLAPDMKLITPPYAPGRHEDGSPDEQGNITETFAGYDYLAEAMSAYFDNTLAFHAYWGDANGSDISRLKDPQTASWYAFRWQRLLALCKSRYNLEAKIVINEAGNYATFDADFYDQIVYFSKQSLSDPRVLALTFFIWEDPTYSPGNIFNVWSEYIFDLPAFTQKLAALPDISANGATPGVSTSSGSSVQTSPVPENPTSADFDGMPVRVMFDDGRIETMPFERYLRAVAPAEMPALWHIEALKAQAIAARTYAANVIRRARYVNKAYDLRANPDIHQNYDLTAIHPRGDQAVLATKGLILTDNIHPIQAVFSANCGGHTFNSEDVFKRSDGSTPPPTPYLRGVSCPNPGPKNGHGVGMCQYGAKAFAEMGLTFDQILYHYYTGVKLITWEFKETVSATASTAGPTPATEWRLNIERIPGYSIINGNLANKAEVQISVTKPNGEKFVTRSGTKPEFGAGGFEALAINPGPYTLEFKGQKFVIQMDGQSTARLTFTTAPSNAPLAQSALTGILADDRKSPIARRSIRLQSASGTLVTKTNTNGLYLFENLPAGTYKLTVPNSPIQETISLDGRQFKSLNLQLAAKTSVTRLTQPSTTSSVKPTTVKPTSSTKPSTIAKPKETPKPTTPPAPLPNDGWTVTAEEMPGHIPLMVGDIGRAREAITVTAPSGAQAVVISGAKPEFGPGGFEAYTPETGTYTFEFLNKRFMIRGEGKMLRLTFQQAGTVVTQPEARLVSAFMPQDKAENILRQLQDKTAIGNLFEIDEEEEE